MLSIFSGRWLQQRSIVARVVDLCGGCIPEVPHADLSKAAFSKLYDLDVGRVKGRECASHAEQLTLSTWELVLMLALSCSRSQDAPCIGTTGQVERQALRPSQPLM